MYCFQGSSLYIDIVAIYYTIHESVHSFCYTFSLYRYQVPSTIIINNSSHFHIQSVQRKVFHQVLYYLVHRAADSHSHQVITLELMERVTMTDQNHPMSYSCVIIPLSLMHLEERISHFACSRKSRGTINCTERIRKTFAYAIYLFLQVIFSKNWCN